MISRAWSKPDIPGGEKIMQEVYHHFDRMNADEEFREAVTNILLAFGYPSLVD
jgi:hypothetical protein